MALRRQIIDFEDGYGGLLALQIEESVMWRADVSVISPMWRVRKGCVRIWLIRVRF
jgi:hypothetical protein